MNKEELIKAWKNGVLNDKGKGDLIEILLNPKLEELQKQLDEVLAKDKKFNCICKDCGNKQPMKGHPNNCKDLECEQRLTEL